MATQSLTQAAELFETNSSHVEVSLNPTEDFGTRIRSISYEAPAFKNAGKFRAAFNEAEKGAHEAAEKKFKAEGDLILYVAKIQSYTSERGANAHLRKAAGIPAGFERWYMEFRQKYDVQFAFKTVQHKIAQLHGGCEHCGRLAENASDHKKSCVLYRPLIEQADLQEGGKRSGAIDMKAATTAYYRDRYLATVGLLCNAPKDAKPEEIIATLQTEAEMAYEGLTEEEAKRITAPKLVKASSRERDDKVICRIAVGLCEMLLEHGQGLKKLAVPNARGDGHTAYPGRTIFNIVEQILKLAQESPDTVASAVASAEDCGKPAYRLYPRTPQQAKRIRNLKS
jgi:hypothetical protein